MHGVAGEVLSSLYAGCGRHVQGGRHAGARAVLEALEASMQASSLGSQQRPVRTHAGAVHFGGQRQPRRLGSLHQQRYDVPEDKPSQGRGGGAEEGDGEALVAERQALRRLAWRLTERAGCTQAPPETLHGGGGRAALRHLLVHPGGHLGVHQRPRQGHWQVRKARGQGCRQGTKLAAPQTGTSLASWPSSTPQAQGPHAK